MMHPFTRQSIHEHALLLEFSDRPRAPSTLCGYSTGRAGYGALNEFYREEVGEGSRDPLGEDFPGNEGALLTGGEDGAPPYEVGGMLGIEMILYFAYRPRPEQVALILARVQAYTKRWGPKLTRAALLVSTTTIDEESLGL